MFERYYLFFPLLSVVLSLRDVQKRILSKPKWEGTSSRKGRHGPPWSPVATALGQDYIKAQQIVLTQAYKIIINDT